MQRTLINVFLLIGLLSGYGSSRSVARQATIEFRNVSVESDFPAGITFRIEVCGRSASSRAVFNYSVSPENSRTGTWSKEVWTIDEGQTSDDCDKRKFHLETKDLDVPPFAPIRYYWTITENSKVNATSPRYVYYYRDENHDWKTIQNKGLVVWWHDRPDSFGQDVMSIASTAYQDQAKVYSETLESPIIIVITNSSDEFFAWQSEESYAGGMAFTDLNLTIQIVEDDVNYYDWANDVVPHEISHVYFDHLVKGFSGASRWFDEGMATYLEYADHYEDWTIVQTAYRENHIRSLSDLVYDFGDDEDDIHLAYAESYYAVLYMHEVYGEQAVAALLDEFQKGAYAETAFQKAFGKTTDEFEKDYVIWLKKRIETAPPNTSHPKPLSTADGNHLFATLILICLLPLCFIGFGAALIVIAWILNDRFLQKKDIKSIS